MSGLLNLCKLHFTCGAEVYAKEGWKRGGKEKEIKSEDAESLLRGCGKEEKRKRRSGGKRVGGLVGQV